MEFVLAVAVCAVPLAVGPSARAAEPPGSGSPPPPNIVLITIESLRPDHVGCYGGARPTTPALDALSRQSTLFERAYSTSSWTLAAHTSLFTGLYPSAAGITLPKDRLAPAYRTLAEILSENGYDTAAIVSGMYLRKVFNLAQGFDHYDESPVTPDGQSEHADVTNPRMEAALTRFVDARGPGQKPFFLFAYFWDPHFDYIPPPPYDSLFVPPGAERVDVRGYHRLQSPVRPGMPPAQIAYVLSQYDGEIRATDDLLGRLFDRLKARGLWDNTVVIVTSDHGEEFFDHGQKGHKNNLFVESVHVPLLVKRTGAAEPRREARLASLVDLFPTVLEAAGYRGELPVHAGRSLFSAGAGRPVRMELTTSWYMTDRRTERKWAETQRWLAQREDGFSVVGAEATEKKPAAWKLFDTTADPGERHPLSGPAADEHLARARAELLAWDQELKQLAAQLGKPQQAPLSPADIERLRAIGYLP